MIYVAKTKAKISCSVKAQLSISVFSCMQKAGFLIVWLICWSDTLSFYIKNVI